MRLRLLILICLAVIATVAVLLRWTGQSEGDQAMFQRIEALAGEGDAAAMAEAVAVKDVEVACRVVGAMGRVGPKAMGGIRVAMKDKRPEVREVAALAVSRAGDEKDTPTLAAVLVNDKSPAVKAAAALTLGRMRAYTEVEALLKAMGDEDVTVRRRASTAIERILGGGVNFNASASEENRRLKIASLRSLWMSMKAKTEQFYQMRKKHNAESAKE